MDKKKNSHKSKILMAMCFICTIAFCVIITLLILFYSSKATTSKSAGSVIVTNHISCSSNVTTYPFFDYDNSDKKELKIDAIFQDESLHSVSLVYRLYYSDNSKVALSEINNHAAMNLSFSQNGLNADALNAAYSEQDDKLQFYLYASDDDLTKSTLQFFMLDSVGKEDYNDETITSHYNHLGMNCEIRN